MARAEMKALVVFLLVVLGCWSLTQARVLTKCEMRDLLKNATANMTLKTRPRGLTADDLLAMIVCQAEQVSGFNTSAVQHQIGKEVPTKHSSEEEEHGGRGHKPAQNCTLYGVFQFSSCQVCNDSVAASANICRMPCSDFLHDDISNDITCVLKIASLLGADHTRVNNCDKIAEEIRPLLVEKCKAANASKYFASCTKP